MEGVADITSRGRVCLVCQKQFSKYTCPKCNIPYCSLGCYKKHNDGCTAAFQEATLKANLKGYKASVEDKKKMLRILKRDHAAQLVEGEGQEEGELEGEEDDKELQDLYRLQVLSLQDDDSLSLDNLTAEEQRDFRRAMVDGRLADMIQLWQPWWITAKEKPAATKPRIVEITETSSTQKQAKLEEQPAHIPEIPQTIPDLATLTKVPPSPALLHNLVDLLFAYVFVQRLYNGDIDTPQLRDEATGTILALSTVLSQNCIYDDTAAVITAVLTSAAKPTLSNGLAYAVAVLHDVATILNNKRFVMAAVSHLRAILLQLLTDDSQGNKKASGGRRGVVLAEKKLAFFLSWSAWIDATILQAESIAVQAAWTEHNQALEAKQAKQAANALHINTDTPTAATVSASATTLTKTAAQSKPRVIELID